MKLTLAQHKALRVCVEQDPHAKVSVVTGRLHPVFCDGRSRGALVDLGCLGWSAGFDSGNTVLPLGRAVLRVLSSDEPA